MTPGDLFISDESDDKDKTKSSKSKHSTSFPIKQTFDKELVQIEKDKIMNLM